MDIKELATPWYRKSTAGTRRGALIKEERETASYRKARLSFLIQSALHLGIPISQDEIEKRLMRH